MSFLICLLVNVSFYPCVQKRFCFFELKISGTLCLAGSTVEVTRETKLKGLVIWQSEGYTFREKEREVEGGGGGGEVRILKDFFQAYGKHRSGVDLQHGRGGRGQTQACKAFTGKRCRITEQVWQPITQAIAIISEHPKEAKSYGWRNWFMRSCEMKAIAVPDFVALICAWLEHIAHWPLSS